MGLITKLVPSYGSRWGRITPATEAREVFFNAQSLIDPDAFDDLVLGQEVEFEEEPSRATGTYAVRVRSSVSATTNSLPALVVSATDKEVV